MIPSGDLHQPDQTRRGVATRRFFIRALGYGPVPGGGDHADDRSEEENHMIIRAGQVMATVQRVGPLTFRFSEVGIIVRRITLRSVTCVAALIRIPMNVDERMRMRPKMRTPGLGCLAETFARGGGASDRIRNAMYRFPTAPSTRRAQSAWPEAPLFSGRM
jgi:hypothetical protein